MQAPSFLSWGFCSCGNVAPGPPATSTPQRSSDGVFWSGDDAEIGEQQEKQPGDLEFSPVVVDLGDGTPSYPDMAHWYSNSPSPPRLSGRESAGVDTMTLQFSATRVTKRATYMPPPKGAEAPTMTGFLVPRFTDPRTEQKFQRRQEKQKPDLGIVVSNFGLIIGALATLVTFWPPLDRSTWFRKISCVVGIGGFLLISVLCRCSLRGWVPLELLGMLYDLLIVTMTLLFTFVGSMTADRTAQMLDLDSHKWPTFPLQEANGTLFVSMVLSLMVIFARPGLRWTLACLCIALPASCAIPIAFGSVEYDMLVEGQADPWTHHAVVLLRGGYMLLIIAALYISRRGQEKQERDAWGMYYITHTKLEDERRLMEQQEERLREFEELKAAVPRPNLLVPSQVGDAKGDLMNSVRSSPNRRTAPPTDLVPAPKVALLRAELSLPTGAKVASPELVMALKGSKTDWQRVRKMASRIRDPSYSLSDYFADCCESFPEVALFAHNSRLSIASAVSASENMAMVEYQKTIGAFFALYWILRLGSDGKRGLCFGVDKDWVPYPSGNASGNARQRKTAAAAKANVVGESLISKMAEEERRQWFLDNMEWQLLEDLVGLAGLAPDAPDAAERITVLLCVTALQGVHCDREYLPSVLEQHAPFEGLAAGSTIEDPRLALRYLLRHFPEHVPSFQGLASESQQSAMLAATGAPLDIGCVVQAEAPPGSMLSGLREALGPSAKAVDVGLYLVRMFTGLAGAEGSPLAGAKRLVLKFPPSVLELFLRAAPHLVRLGPSSETEVVEEYLRARWSSAVSAGVIKTDDEPTLACMRLLTMAKNDQRVIEGFLALPDEDQKCLESELSLTGCMGQRYSTAGFAGGGPALLLSHAPAFLQHHTLSSTQDCIGSLRVLAEVFRAARATWPVSAELEGATRTVLLQVNGQPMQSLARPAAGDIWVFLPEGDQGVVELMRASNINDLQAKGAKVRMLEFGAVLDPPGASKLARRPCLNGRWKCVDTWGLDEFLKSMGVSKLQRMAASRASWPTWVFEQEEDHIVFVNHAALGELREEFTVDGSEYAIVDGYKRQIKCEATWKGGNTLVIVKSGPEGLFREERSVGQERRLHFKQIKLREDGSDDISWGRTFERES